MDLHYFHHGGFGPDNRYLQVAADLMRQFKQEGKVRVIGQSAYSYGDFQRFCPVTQPDVLQLPYSAPGGGFTREGLQRM